MVLEVMWFITAGKAWHWEPEWAGLCRLWSGSSAGCSYAACLLQHMEWCLLHSEWGFSLHLYLNFIGNTLIDMPRGVSPRGFQIQWRQASYWSKMTLGCFFLCSGEVSGCFRIETEEHRLSMSVQDFPHKGQVSRPHYSRGIYDSSKNSVVFGVRSAGVKRETVFQTLLVQSLMNTWEGPFLC